MRKDARGARNWGEICELQPRRADVGVGQHQQDGAAVAARVRVTELEVVTRTQQSERAAEQRGLGLVVSSVQTRPDRHSWAAGRSPYGVPRHATNATGRCIGASSAPPARTSKLSDRSLHRSPSQSLCRAHRYRTFSKGRAHSHECKRGQGGSNPRASARTQPWRSQRACPPTGAGMWPQARVLECKRDPPPHHTQYLGYRCVLARARLRPRGSLPPLRGGTRPARQVPAPAWPLAPRAAAAQGVRPVQRRIRPPQALSLIHI